MYINFWYLRMRQNFKTLKTIGVDPIQVLAVDFSCKSHCLLLYRLPTFCISSLDHRPVVGRCTRKWSSAHTGLGPL